MITGNGSLMSFLSKFSNDPLFISRNSYNVHNQVMDQYFNGQEGPGTDYFRVQFKITKDQWERMDNTDMSNVKGLIKQAQNYMYSENEGYSEHFQALLDMLREDTTRPNLKIQTNCKNCMVRTKFYSLLSDYFACPIKQRRRIEINIYSDVIAALQEIDKDYKGNRMKPKKHKEFLLSTLMKRLPTLLSNSIIFCLQRAGMKYLAQLDDKGLKEFIELRKLITNLDFESPLKDCKLKGSFVEMMRSREKLFMGMAKKCRTELMNTSLYRDICKIAMATFEKIATRFIQLYRKNQGSCTAIPS